MAQDLAAFDSQIQEQNYLTESNLANVGDVASPSTAEFTHEPSGLLCEQTSVYEPKQFTRNVRSYRESQRIRGIT